MNVEHGGMPLVAYNSKDLRHVSPFVGATVRYMFPTNVDNSVQTTFGQLDLGGLAGVAAITPKRPKPPRYGRQRSTLAEQNQFGSSFIDSGSIATATAAGFRQVKSAVRGGTPRNGELSINVKAEVIPGVEYAWSMPKTQYNRVLNDLATMGVTPVTAADTNVVVAADGFYTNNAANSIVYSAKLQIAQGLEDEDIITVGFVGYQQVDNLPDGWVAAINSSKKVNIV